MKNYQTPINDVTDYRENESFPQLICKCSISIKCNKWEVLEIYSHIFERIKKWHKYDSILKYINAL